MHTPNDIDDLLEEFEREWSEGRLPQIEEFASRSNLSAEHSLLIEELVKVDIHWQWHQDTQAEREKPTAADVAADKTCRYVESYAERFPELTNSSSFPTAFIAEELRVRAAVGEAVDRAEVIGRFPGLSDSELDEIWAMSGLAPPKTHSQMLPISGQEFCDRYLIQRQIGAGGMGAVFLAKDQKVGREVAIKTPLSNAGSALKLQEYRQRLLREGRAAAQINHPNVVTTFEVVDLPACSFVVYEFIEGESLREWLTHGNQNERLAPEFVARTVHLLAEALHSTHSAGVLHRDLKPANVVMERLDAATESTPANAVEYNGVWFRPRVVDFGLATAEMFDSKLTMTGAFLGTAAYMSPEQASGEVVGPGADVFALGVILYEMLSGCSPFECETFAATIDKVRTVDPSPLRKVRSEVAGDLSAIAECALDKSPLRRYRDAQEFANDLMRFIQGKPVKARRVGPIDRAVRWTKRNPLAAGLLCLTSVAFLFAVSQNLRLQVALTNESELRGVADAEKKKADEARDKYDESAKQANELAEKLMAELYLSDTKEALEALGRGQMFSVRNYTDKYRNRDFSSLHGFEYKLLDAASSIKPIAEFTGHPGKVLNLAAYDNGRKIAAVGEGRDGFLWDVETQRLEAKISDSRWTLGALQDFAMGTKDSTNNEFRAVAVSPDGKYLATGNVRLGLWELSTGKKVRTLGRFATPVYGVAFSPDSRLVAAHCANFSLKIFDLSGDVVRTINTESHGRRICFSADGSRLFVPECIDGAIFVTEFDTATWEPVHRFPRIIASHGLGLFEKHGLLFIARKQDFDVFDLQTRKHLIRSEEFSGVITDIAVSPDESHIAISLSSGLAAVLPVNRKYWEAGRPVRAKERVFAAHSGATESVQFLDNEIVATGGGDGAVRIWGLSDPEVLLNHRLNGRVAFAKNRPGTDELIVLDVNVAGRTALKRFHLRQQSTTQELELFDPGAHDLASSFAVSHDGRFAAVGGSSAEVHVVDLQLNKSVLEFRQDDIRSSGIRDIALSPDGKLMATASADHTIRVWNVSTGKELWRRRCAGHGINVEFSDDGKRLAFSEDQGVLGIIATSDFQPLAETELLVPVSSKLVWTDGGRRICAALADGKIATLDSNSLQIIRKLEGAETRCWELAVAPDGVLLAGADVGGIRLWHLPSGKLLGTLLSGLDIQTVSFTDSGESLCAVDYSAGSSLVVWDVAAAETSP